eukprot:TRINITY_DN106685_c0_g1_i1.p1 TRINITY_DN106685_c0_g1~~TRINITY_DN106685_c0_g1_i1.p1  ORF type:complete len:310 (+),score=25.96 TRINITY_DN106685_c0_g1_i1:110-931(+)
MSFELNTGVPKVMGKSPKKSKRQSDINQLFAFGSTIRIHPECSRWDPDPSNPGTSIVAENLPPKVEKREKLFLERVPLLSSVPPPEPDSDSKKHTVPLFGRMKKLLGRDRIPIAPDLIRSLQEKPPQSDFIQINEVLYDITKEKVNVKIPRDLSLRKLWQLFISMSFLKIKPSEKEMACILWQFECDTKGYPLQKKIDLYAEYLIKETPGYSKEIIEKELKAQNNVDAPEFIKIALRALEAQEGPLHQSKLLMSVDFLNPLIGFFEYIQGNVD